MSQAFQYIHFQDRALIPKGFSLLSPLNGTVTDLSNHALALYHSGVMGPGVCFHISGHQFHAPFDGKISRRSADGNQLLLTASNGLQLLIQFFGEANCLRTTEDLTPLHVGQAFKQGEFLAYVETRRLQRQHPDQHCAISVFNADHFGKIYCGAKRFTAAEDVLFTMTARTSTQAIIT